MNKVYVQLRTMLKHHVFLAVLVGLLVLPGLVSAATMTFVNLYSGYVDYVESGLRVTSNAAMYLNQGGNGQAMYPSTRTQTMTLTLEAGGTFTLHSIDVSERDYSGPQTVVFVGTLSGGGTVTATLTTDGILAFETIQFPATFTDLTSVSWDESDPTATCLYDNIVASPVGPVSSEPATWGVIKARYSNQ